LNTSAQFGYSVTRKIHQHLTNILLPLINPATTGLFAHTVDMIEENIDEKDNILSLIKKSTLVLLVIFLSKRENIRNHWQSSLMSIQNHRYKKINIL
jgi:hypothetical protein